MEAEYRPYTDKILEAIKREEKIRSKGKLKIFLGMAAGVGKTYSMLEHAQQLHKMGIKIVVGIIETHGREEIASLLNGLKVIPPKIISYRGKEFQELDLDAVIKLHPQLVLVDELAHSNIPGSRHAKRWQDVMEILENQIDVYTTLNVQHIESLNDVVEGITTVSIRETVPDVVIEAATSIQLVDITPDELLHRLDEGKVYLGDQSKLAAANFFQKGRLTALREIVLRFAAEIVDHSLQTESFEKQTIDWKTRNKLLVAVSSSPYSQKLIRTTRRLAFNLGAPWIAVYVNDGSILSESENNLLSRNLALARDLGAEVITTNDLDIANGIQRIARLRGITQIVIGRVPARRFLGIFPKRTILDKLASECKDIDIHIIRQERGVKPPRKSLKSFFSQENLYSYIWVFLWVLLSSGINGLLLPWIGYKVVGALFLLGILFLSLFFKKGPIFFASILYALIWDYFFIPPVGHFVISSTEDTVLLVIYLLTGIVTGILVDRAREQKEMLSKREETSQELFEIVRQITTAASKSDLRRTIEERLSKILNGTIEIVIKIPDNGITFEDSSVLLSNDNEKNICLWVFNNGKEAGWSTRTLPSSPNLYIPLKGYKEIVGVLVYNPNENRTLSNDEKNFLYTVGQQLSYYLERSFAEERTKQEEYLHQAEKIYETVFNTMSSNLRRPINNIQSAIEVMNYARSKKEKKVIEGQIQQIETSSEGLRHILDNITTMAKLSGTIIPINKEIHDVQKVGEAFCEKAKKSIGNRNLIVNIQPNLGEATLDLSLIEILLQNLFTHAVECTAPDSSIDLQIKKIENELIISISDESQGIPSEQLEAAFEHFYDVPNVPSAGLSLAIAKKIADIHGGRLIAENRPEKGIKFTLFLPI